MRISELARRGGVPVGTVKYYLREGLLPAGTLTSTTQAQYGEDHVARLELVRVLLQTGGLAIATVRTVLDAIDNPPDSVYQLLGTAHTALGPAADAGPAATDKARRLVARWSWIGTEHGPALGQLAAALEGIETVGFGQIDGLLDRYAALMAEVAAVDVAAVPTGSAAEAVRFTVAGTVLFEPLLLALRRLAQGDAAARRFGATAPHPDGTQ